MGVRAVCKEHHTVLLQCRCPERHLVSFRECPGPIRCENPERLVFDPETHKSHRVQET